MANYLYNGVELPALPISTYYPYWYIVYDPNDYHDGNIGADSYVLVGSVYPLYRHVFSDGSSSNHYTQKSGYVWYVISNGVWDRYWSGDAEYDIMGTPLVWSNHNVNYADGTLFFAASDPVPVPDEPDTPDEPETVLAWQKHDAYKPNTKWDGNTFYKVIGNKWVKHDAVVPAETLPEPVAYLYNGVELPDINEVWTDKVTYPYAMITRTITDGTCLLHVCGDMPYYTEQAHSTEGYEPTVIAPKPYKAFAHVDGSWVLNTEETDYGFSIRTGSFELIWTNVDVMNKDNGSVYFDASEPPVPVYA